MKKLKMNFYSSISILIIFAFLIIPKALYADKDYFDVLDLSPGGKVNLCLKVDLDLNGSDEIACVYTKGNYPDAQPYIKAYEFKRNESGRFTVNELFAFMLDKKFVLIDYAKSHLAQRNLFYAMAADGVYELDYSSGKLNAKQIIKKNMLVGSGEYGDISYVDFVRDYDLDGFIEVLAFEKNGYSFWEYNDKNIFIEKTFFNLKPRFFYSSSYGDNPFWKKFNFRSVYLTQEVVLSDFDNDGNKDILFFWEDELDVYWGNPKTGFSGDSHSKFRFKEISENERDEKNTYVIYFVGDLNSDGLPDLIMNKFKGAFTSHVSDTKILFRTNPRGIEAKEMIYESDKGDWEGGVARDINGNGKKDFVLVTGSFGVFSILKAVMKGKIDIKFSFHYYDDKSVYPRKADYSRKISMGFSLRKADMTGILPNLDYDFNADGLPDVFYATETNEIRLIFGRENRHYSLNSVKKFKVDVSKSFILCDVDGDKKTDVVFYNKKGKNKDKIKVLGNLF